MHKSYRTFSLQALRTGPLEIAEKISEHKALLEEAKDFISKSILKYVLIWAFGLSFAIAFFLGIIFLSVFVGVTVFILLVVLTLVMHKLPVLHTRLEAQKRYTEHNKQIKQSTQAIEELYSKAKAYQSRLEISSGPGFVATFQDILLSPYYPSFFPQEDRHRFVSLSGKGLGQEIDIFEYGRLLFELKANGLVDYVDVESLVEKVKPQNKYNAAIDYARLIVANLPLDNADQVRFLALVGLNAWLACQEQGRPETIDHVENDQWEIIKIIFRSVLNDKTAELAKAVGEFNALEQKLSKKRS